MKVFHNILELIGNTPMLKIQSLSELTGNNIYVKCENFNPGGTIKDRAAKQMVLDAIESGKLRTGMSIVEGTAGNTGIGLALVAKALGYKMTVVMPKGQAAEKEKLVTLYGADLVLADVVPFKNENHFYHTARKMGEENPGFWWANQFENLSNFKAHYENTAPEIFKQLDGKIEFFVASAGTGGTMGGNSAYLKEKIPSCKTILADPDGSGLYSYIKTGEFKSSGDSLTEGIGIMRLTANLAKGFIDDAVEIHDPEVVAMAYHLREKDGLLVGTSSALNIMAAYKLAKTAGKNKNIVTLLCDSGERAASKLYNLDYLQQRGLTVRSLDSV